MKTRRILVSVSVVGVAVTLFAFTEGQWTYGLGLYGFSVAAILVLLRQALRERRRSEARGQVTSATARPAARDAGALVD